MEIDIPELTTPNSPQYPSHRFLSAPFPFSNPLNPSAYHSTPHLSPLGRSDQNEKLRDETKKIQSRQALSCSENLSVGNGPDG